MRAAAAPSGGPEGRQKQASRCPDFNKSSPHEAGVELAFSNYRVRAAGRGVGRAAGAGPTGREHRDLGARA